jgi:hypothetical protein
MELMFRRVGPFTLSTDESVGSTFGVGTDSSKRLVVPGTVNGVQVEDVFGLTLQFLNLDLLEFKCERIYQLVALEVSKKVFSVDNIE